MDEAKEGSGDLDSDTKQLRYRLLEWRSHSERLAAMKESDKNMA